MPQKPKPLDETKSMRAWWGKELRNWREARGMSSRELGAKVHLSATSIERIEKDERPCNANLASQLDDAVQAGGALRRLWRLVEEEADKRSADADKTPGGPTLDGIGTPTTGMLGLSPPVFSERSLSPVERRAFFTLGGIAALAPGAFIDLLPGSGPTALPKMVRPEDIEQVTTAAVTLAGWDNLYGGGGIARSSSAGLFIWARGLLATKYPPQLESDLYTAVGRLSMVMGASAFDAYEHHDATELLRFGTWCAERANNWHLRAAVLNWRARHEIWCGRPDEGLTHAENGLVRADRLTHREQATLHNARARAWAKMQRPKEALAAIRQSDEVFDRARDGEDAPWMAYYDEAQHHGDSGHAAFDIALMPGQSPSLAVSRLKTAIEGHTDDYVRSRALSGAKLATLTMATGDPQQAVVIANRALDEVGRLRSKRAATDMQDLSKASARYARKPEVAELRSRITTTVLA
ncbi:transcriptional regulator [Streptomyces sp. MUSC 14]|uniref:helix-turn-helix domain-containing protein n=1 Tax=Streptomyces sp. MUSC 14 TaxID=1354889 RepID=UPI0008F5BE98|nr:helix-turn-helix transcriptional regulator [Streptomyces sp. MUSC 14]OIK02558.1 transcriptional regulator [Streptomyces sp. MUSC 14]